MFANISVAAAFLDGIKNRNLSRAPLAENVSYESPLAGEPIRGREHVIRFLGVYLPIINDVQVTRHIADGDYVATVWRAETSFGPMSLVNVFRFEAGKIVEIQAFHDPRGFLERMGRGSVASMKAG